MNLDKQFNVVLNFRSVVYLLVDLFFIKSSLSIMLIIIGNVLAGK